MSARCSMHACEHHSPAIVYCSPHVVLNVLIRAMFLEGDPRLIAFAQDDFLQHRPIYGNCIRSCKWAPDGTCLATNSEDHTLRLFNLPANLYTMDLDNACEMVLFVAPWFACRVCVVQNDESKANSSVT